MTAAMRAVPLASGPRLLRVGVVRHGRMVDERLLHAREQLTVGTTEKATVVVSGAGVGARQLLFEHKSGAYWLHDVAGVSGSLVIAGARQQLGGDAFEPIRLAPNARGRLTVGDTTFLFQQIVPAPHHTRVQLPLSVQKSFISDVDWFTTVVAAFSFLLHFFMVALVYSDWMDQVVDDGVTVTYLVESVKQLPPPPTLEKPMVDVSDAATAKAVSDTKAATKPAAQSRGKNTKNGGKKNAASSDGKSAGGDNGGAAARGADIAAQLAALNLETLSALGEAGPSTKKVLGDGGAPIAMLDAQGRSDKGADESDPGGLGIGGDGDGDANPFSDKQRRLDQLGNTRRAHGESATDAGVKKKVKGPVGNVVVVVPQPSGDSFPGAGGAIAGLRGRFRRCYQRGLDDNPGMAGSVTLAVRVGPNGEVLSASGGGSGGLSAIVPCLTAAVRSANFGPSSGGSGAMFSIPIRFIKAAR